jgi:hypothetical protein
MYESRPGCRLVLLGAKMKTQRFFAEIWERRRVIFLVECVKLYKPNVVKHSNLKTVNIHPRKNDFFVHPFFIFRPKKGVEGACPCPRKSLDSPFFLPTKGTGFVVFIHPVRQMNTLAKLH